METTTPKELHRALLDQDARLRSDLSGVKSVRYWAGLGTIGAAATSFTTPPLVASGFVWAVMNIGVELSASANVLIYLLGLSANGVGFNRFVGIMPNGGGSRALGFSKGQLMLNAGEYITVAPASGNIMSLMIYAIQVPAERQGELLL